MGKEEEKEKGTGGRERSRGWGEKGKVGEEGKVEGGLGSPFPGTFPHKLSVLWAGRMVGFPASGVTGQGSMERPSSSALLGDRGPESYPTLALSCLLPTQ